MKFLKTILPWLFLIFSVGTALVTTIQVRGILEEIPGGILTILEGTQDPVFFILEKEDKSPLYKNGAIQQIKSSYGIDVSEKELIELDPLKILLSQGWILWLMAVYLLIMVLLWKHALNLFMTAYLEYMKQPIPITIRRIFSGIFLYAVSIGIWYLIFTHIQIPQQYISSRGIWDIGYLIERLQMFCKEVQENSKSIPCLAAIQRAYILSAKGYLSGFLLFLPCWIKGMYFDQGKVLDD